MEEKKKNNIGIIILLIIIILGLAGYIAYDKFLSKETKEEVAQKEELDPNDDLVQELFSMFKISGRETYMSVEGLNNDNKLKLRIAYENIPLSNIEYANCSDFELYEDFKYYCNDSDSLDTMVKYVVEGKTKEAKELEKQGRTKSINEEIIEREMHIIFGNDYEVKHESFNCTTTEIMQYNEKKHIYGNFISEGGVYVSEVNQKVKKAYKENDKLIIETKITTKETKEESTKVIYTFQKDKENGNYVFKNVKEEK